ncbi:42-9-9 protein-related [Holotrichia oblita]|uniref:42-9-9 protein-related n=1 Tax=Holotrichia oblita TaxID=644536 RepID=A0ACB9T626_HOLOL|nr:42-9-9 protein-related [Holotrichia oblita]
MVVKHQIEGYPAFCEFIDKLKDNKGDVHVLFSGSKMETGQSWCPTCVQAKPVIEEALNQAEPDSQFVYVEVGDRAYWKDPNCPFRTDKRTSLLVLPTLLRWGQPQRLQGDQCKNPDLVEMLFQDD